MQLEVDEHVNAVLLRETIDDVVSMLPNPSGKITRHTDIERSVTPARKDIDGWLFQLLLLPSTFEACGMPPISVPGLMRVGVGFVLP